MVQQEKLVPVKEIAERMGLERTAARKWLKRQGYRFVPARDPISRQRVNALPVSQARSAIELRRQLGFPVPRDGAAGLRGVSAIG